MASAARSRSAAASSRCRLSRALLTLDNCDGGPGICVELAVLDQGDDLAEMTSSPMMVPVKTRNGSNFPVVIWMINPVTAATIRA